MRIPGIRGFGWRFTRRHDGPVGLSEEYAGITEDISRTGYHARVVFGD
ncbi:hypothetical protein [Streptomyces sp. NPDC056660]